MPDMQPGVPPSMPQPKPKKSSKPSNIWPIAIMAFAIVALLLLMDISMGIFSNGSITK